MEQSPLKPGSYIPGFFVFVRCVVALVLLFQAISASGEDLASLKRSFIDPPDSARPWVYWYFMDGNMTADGMRHDLEAMKRAGIGGAILLEVDIGIPRGPVQFMSEQWQDLVR